MGKKVPKTTDVTELQNGLRLHFFCCIREYKVKYESANTFVTYLTLPPKQPIDNAQQIFTLSPTKLYSVENYSFLSSLFHHKLLLMTKRDEDEDKFE